MLIGPRALKSLNSIENIYDSPTNVFEEIDLLTFYNELSSLVRSIPKHNVLVIGGDMNAQIGKNVNHKFRLHNSSNKNQTDFTLENR